MDVELLEPRGIQGLRGLNTAELLEADRMREQMIARLSASASLGNLRAAMRVLTSYAGASHFLLARYDLIQEQGLDFVVTADWPFDLVRGLAIELSSACSRSTELEKCLSLLQAKFVLLPDDLDVPEGASRQYCSVMFNVGRTRFALVMLLPEGFIISPDRLREVGLLAAYCVSLSTGRDQKADRDFELTERELECLFWIAEGKTSDEIATILGISRNTINNYITSVMRKTATKTRSEAIAYAVRNNLV
ncbi:transcriptional regulator VisN [Rhizobium paknamense]|uniref:DNA-binding CsgD family transcriptional regulator n=1 Tax=Rhizobium paknamense TaxID=1206817 RepID=A0ABU0IH64_9HYPH|nr:helix-turn-helix transcriptional regulator [Rhizobium paknamense]MDQ0456576.1 DNA-binding CsgD family transcriptional regulator [Rhizobium paknamense]